MISFPSSQELRVLVYVCIEGRASVLIWDCHLPLYILVSYGGLDQISWSALDFESVRTGKNKTIMWTITIVLYNIRKLYLVWFCLWDGNHNTIWMNGWEWWYSKMTRSSSDDLATYTFYGGNMLLFSSRNCFRRPSYPGLASILSCIVCRIGVHKRDITSIMRSPTWAAVRYTATTS